MIIGYGLIMDAQVPHIKQTGSMKKTEILPYACERFPRSCGNNCGVAERWDAPAHLIHSATPAISRAALARSTLFTLLVQKRKPLVEAAFDSSSKTFGSLKPRVPSPFHSHGATASPVPRHFEYAHWWNRKRACGRHAGRYFQDAA